MTRRDLSKNAWLVGTKSFEYFLNEIYREHWGEVWLYNNDLAVFKNHELFEKLYIDLISNKLRRNIDAIKILLPEKLFNEFKKDENILQNLERLKTDPERLATFYIGNLDKASPKLRYGSDRDDRWIFYTTKRQLTSENGTVMLRHNIYPFSMNHVHEHEDERVAICWMNKDVETLKKRLDSEAFQSCFTNPNNFGWIKIINKNRFSIDFGKGLSLETKRRSKQRIRQKNHKLIHPEIGKEVDAFVVTALDDELTAVLDKIPEKFKTHKYPGIYFASLPSKSGASCRIILSCFGEMGNTDSAVGLFDLLNKWSPNCVILTGIAGGNKIFDKHLRLGDVAVSHRVFAYEYQKISHSPNFSQHEFNSQNKKSVRLCKEIKKWFKDNLNCDKEPVAWLNSILEIPRLYDIVLSAKPAFSPTDDINKLKEETDAKRDSDMDDLSDQDRNSIKELNRLLIETLHEKYAPKSGRLIERRYREGKSSQSLGNAADMLIRDIRTKVAKLKLSDDNRMNSQHYLAFRGHFATGCKIVADDKYLSNLLSEKNSKVVAIEMEAEGVIAAAEKHFPRPDVIIIKGISDYADSATKGGPNSDQYRKHAKDAAADFVINFFRACQIFCVNAFWGDGHAKGILPSNSIAN